MKKKLTARSVAAIKPSDHRQEFFDTLLPGFGLRMSPSGSRRWFVKVRQAGRQRRITIPATSLADARRAARRLIASPPTPTRGRPHLRRRSGAVRRAMVQAALQAVEIYGPGSAP